MVLLTCSLIQGCLIGGYTDTMGELSVRGKLGGSLLHEGEQRELLILY